MSICLHGVWEHGKTLTGAHCFDYRLCLACGAKEFKQQWERWDSHTTVVIPESVEARPQGATESDPG